jgi:hypothetical protein
MRRENTKTSVKITCMFEENGEHPAEIVARSFAAFLAGEMEKDDAVSHARLSAGGVPCTQK